MRNIECNKLARPDFQSSSSCGEMGSDERMRRMVSVKDLGGKISKTLEKFRYMAKDTLCGGKLRLAAAEES